MFRLRWETEKVIVMRTAALVMLVSTGLYAQRLAIVGARVIDGTGAAPSTKTVIVNNGRIEACAEGLAAPEGATLINGSGLTLLPGLFDLHTHLLASAGRGSADWGKNLKAYLLSGVTTVADMSTNPEQFEPMRRLLDGALSGPHVLMAARFSSPGGHGAEAGRGDFHTQLVQTPVEARAAVRRVVPYRPDVLKVFTDGWRYGMATDMTSMDEGTLAALVDEAHKNGLVVVGHTVTLERAKIAARAGVDVLNHGVSNAVLDDEALSLMKANRTGYVQTMAVYEPRPGRDTSSPLLPLVLEPALKGEMKLPTEPAEEGARDTASVRGVRWQNLLTNARRYRDAGLRQAVGTDAGMGGTYHGWSTLHEVELLVKGGLSPLEAITAATATSARYLKLDQDRGTIEPGRRADLVLVEGDPSKNIHDIHNVRQVLIDGKPLDLAALARDIASPEKTPMEARKPAALIDDFEAANGRTRLDTLWINNTDAGHDHSKMSFQRTARADVDGRALTVLCEFSVKPSANCAVVAPLSKGAVEPVDASGFTGVEFEVRGDGEYGLVAETMSVRDRDYFRGAFKAAPKWTTVRVPFESLKQRGRQTRQVWTGRDLVALDFVMAPRGATERWLELDNIRFYK